ncbi:unnamed protein product [Didymodactylos carnosus]|uniref:Sterol 3-beta-glucosyltransferase n=1 Tax=Didymodactylos carnosus TaxID=1234261 RepID=A0A814E361_9BILA|nr:unnamed protein product [Didymodactylos carnosus]CAF0964044.1 unnamed protein product [Didymodactylos carnosus]CAF3529860.1 unnamed protein product [Didymodactylos carnosus]CAF3737844.1 unnamed protein product [Didymodactylos carnosus]
MSHKKDDIPSTLVVNFDKEWLFKQLQKSSADNNIASTEYNDQQWERVSLPHKQEQLEPIYNWYRKYFELNNEPEDKKKFYYLYFDQDDQITVDIWINNIKILNDGSFLSCSSLDITQYVRFEEKNLVVLCVVNDTLHLQVRLIITDETTLTLNSTHGQTIYSGQIPVKHKHHIPLEYTASLTNEGRIDLCINEDKKCRNEYLSELQKQSQTLIHGKDPNERDRLTLYQSIPHLTICIMVVGSRGDVQPFIAFGKELLKVGHRVRLATHKTFENFVRENDLEFYPLGGDPADLMSFMVKNAGIIPSVSSIFAGDIQKNREQLFEILKSTWRACTEPDNKTGEPFIAEAIISNPPTFGHIHCAQKLNIPLHICFTMPWSPTSAFPHPLCRVDYTKWHAIEKINLLSYQVVEMLTWSAMRDLINNFRKNTLGLEKLHTRKAIHLIVDEHVPHTYCWSPCLVAKPEDWGEHIDVSGFFFLEKSKDYKPPTKLVEFLQNGDRPFYIGFGSITGHNSKHLYEIVVEALERGSFRAVILGDWAGINENSKIPANIYLIKDCPHDWLFQYVAAVCHHGGAGTTAAGLRLGKPTIIVPFFGDQYFWGAMVAQSNAGPKPLPGKHLNANDLFEAFKFALTPEVKAAAEKLANKIKNEDGVGAAVKSFHNNLPLYHMSSDLESTYAARYYLPDYDMKISLPVAQVLTAGGAIDESELRNYHTKVWGFQHDHNILRKGHRAFSNFFTWITRGLFHSSKEEKEDVLGLPLSRSRSSSLVTVDNSPEGLAAAKSGFTKPVCRNILNDFKQIQMRHKILRDEYNKARIDAINSNNVLSNLVV